MRTQILFFILLLSSIVCAKNRHDLQPYLVDSTDTLHAAIIICPGGSYSWLSMREEGEEVALWLNSWGINAFVLPYRVATLPAYIFGFRVLGLGHTYPDMLEDMQMALTYLYTHADSLHIDTTRIGVMGFSAGGHLALMSYLYNHTPYRPSFLCTIYPVVSMSHPEYTHKRSRLGALGVWGQWNEQMRDSLSIEKHVTKDCPPVFIMNCRDDQTVDYQNGVLLDSALSANQVPHLYLQYATGGHGFAVSDKKCKGEACAWKKIFINWFMEYVYKQN